MYSSSQYSVSHSGSGASDFTTYPQIPVDSDFTASLKLISDYIASRPLSLSESLSVDLGIRSPDIVLSWGDASGGGGTGGGTPVVWLPANLQGGPRIWSSQERYGVDFRVFLIGLVVLASIASLTTGGVVYPQSPLSIVLFAAGGAGIIASLAVAYTIASSRVQSRS